MSNGYKALASVEIDGYPRPVLQRVKVFHVLEKIDISTQTTLAIEELTAQLEQFRGIVFDVETREDESIGVC